MFMRFWAPPICWSMRGSMALWSCCMTLLGLRCICLAMLASPYFMRPDLPILETTRSNCLWHLRSMWTSMGWVPEPRATRSSREGALSRSTRPSSSSSVMESIMYMKRRRRLPPSSSGLPEETSCGMPGIMAMTLFRGPSFMTFSNCSYMSLKVKTPLANFSTRWSGWFLSPPTVSLICSTRPRMSPMPRRRETKERGLKGSKSSKCSPDPRKTTGAPVAATAESAPPPLAWPSSLVTTTEPISTASWKALAWSPTDWPCVASSTKTTSSGDIASLISCISSNSADSCRCRPEVSTMITSYLSFRNWATPSSAILTGSASLNEP
mmetsp:Transcript_18724/g.58874  ORF Transcript_18724/g.58874 Transcript_18724/m.58874 type:complete len:324 (+) Transcript_18724:806-1777(+)